jgi:hypothetical protein
MSIECLLNLWKQHESPIIMLASIQETQPIYKSVPSSFKLQLACEDEFPLILDCHCNLVRDVHKLSNLPTFDMTYYT